MGVRVPVFCLAVLSLAPAPAQTPVEVEMRSARFHGDRDIALCVRSLRGRMTPTGKEPVTFDDPNFVRYQGGPGPDCG